jgi:hypothetical protein
MHPLPEDCLFRSNVHRLSGGEFATCALVERWFPGSPGAVSIKREVCEHCCLSEPPEPDRPNDVIASQIYLRSGRVVAAPEGQDGSAAAAAQAREAAASALKTLWRTPNDARWTGTVHNLSSTTDVIDAAVNADTFTGHLSNGEPFAYLRYGDGEWLSILGQAGRNADLHDFFPETLGRELQQSFLYAAGLGPRKARFYMGLHAMLYQDAIRRYLVEHGIAYRMHWVSDNLFALGFFDMSTYRFLQAVKGFPGPKVLAGNASLAPVAAGLGCRHVVVPRIDCYREIDQIHQQARFTGTGLLICCAGMASECVICRAHLENPDGSYVDCGHIFDSLVGNYTRNYTQGNWDGINDFLNEQYAPLLFEHTKRRSDPG